MFSLVVLALFASSVVSFSPISQHLPAAITIRRRGEQQHTTSFSITTLSMAAPTLYGSPGSRSPLVNWAAYELNVPLVMASDLSKNPHPFGQIPCLTDDDDGGVVVFESGAILNYLQSKADSNKVLHGDARTAAITSWIAWANASLDPICFLEREGRVWVYLYNILLHHISLFHTFVLYSLLLTTILSLSLLLTLWISTNNNFMDILQKYH